MSILNLTQHPATPEQVAAGVVDLPAEARPDLQVLLTFDELPDTEEICLRADSLAGLAAIYAAAEDREDGAGFALSAMIGGAPYLMAPLEAALRAQGIEPCYAFSQRTSEEQPQADGTVRKINVFRHAGFVAAVSAV